MKIIFTTPILEFPAAGGPQLRIENSIKALARACELHLVSRVPLRELGGVAAERHFRSLSQQFSYTPEIEGLSKNRYVRKAQKIARKFRGCQSDAAYLLELADRIKADAIWFGYGNVSFDLIRRIKSDRPGLKVVCDTDSVWSRFVLRELPYIDDPARRAKIEAEGRRKEEEERAWVNLCEVTAAVSDVDEEYYRSIASEPERVMRFSNVIDLASYASPPPPPAGFRRPAIYLAGSFWPQSPMEQAARWVLDEILPLVRRALPDVHLYIVGNGSREVLADVVAPSVTVTGKLPSVLPYLCNADVALVPLKFESGTRFKILEAAACGVPVVSTTLGAEGIPVEHGRDILLADETEAFADAVVEMIRDRGLARRCADNSRSLVSSLFSVESLAEEARTILERLGGTHG